MSLRADNISIPQSLTALIVTPGDQDGAARTDASARDSMTRMHNPKIHTEQTKEQSESKITMKSCDILFFVSLYMQIYFFLIRFDFVTSNIGKMNRSICRAEKRISFRKSRHAFIFTRKTTQISQPPRSVNCQSELSPSLSHAARRSLQKKKHSTKKKRKEQ